MNIQHSSKQHTQLTETQDTNLSRGYTCLSVRCCRSCFRCVTLVDVHCARLRVPQISPKTFIHMCLPSSSLTARRKARCGGFGFSSAVAIVPANQIPERQNFISGQPLLCRPVSLVLQVIDHVPGWNWGISDLSEAFIHNRT